MWKNILAALALLVLATQGAQAQSDKISLCFVTFSLQIAYFQSSVAGGKGEAEKLGVDLVVLDPQADAQKQVTLFEDCIARKVGGIVVDPIESGALGGVIEEAGKQGIKVAVLDTPIHADAVITNTVETTLSAAGQTGCNAAGVNWGENGSEGSFTTVTVSCPFQTLTGNLIPFWTGSFDLEQTVTMRHE